MSVVISINHDSSTNLTDASNYTSSSGADISIATGAALQGTTNGLNILCDDATSDYAYKALGTASTTGTYRCRFYIDPNSITQNSGTDNYVLWMRNFALGVAVAVALRWNGSTYQMVFLAYNDVPTPLNLTVTSITDAPHCIELLITRATTNASSDGTFYAWIDGNAVAGSLTNIDNYDKLPEFSNIRFGCVTTVAAGSSGTYFLDELIINDDGGEIGPGLWATSLTAAENTQSQTCDAAEVSFTPAGDPTVNLTAAENTQTQASDPATVRATSIVTAHGVSLESIIDAAVVTFKAPPVNLTAGENTQAQASDAAVVSFGIGYSVTAAENTQTQTSDPAVLRARYPLTAVDNTQAQASDAATLKAYYPLTGAENTQTQTSDPATVTFDAPGVYGIAGAENTQAQTNDAVTLSARYPVTAGENTQAQTGDGVVISVVHLLTAGENTQAQTSDAANLSYSAPGAGITPSENTQAQTMDAPVLVAFYPIAAGENTQAQLSDAGIVAIMALLLHGNRKLYKPDARVTHYVPARVTLEVDDD